ncbi:MAG: alpha/beta fold hydrolase [Brevefilum sp.]
MKKSWKITLGILGGLLLLVLIGPFLMPVTSLEGTQPPESLADENSRFIEINGLSVHYKQEGSGSPAFILLHGFGASTFSWREVIEPLANIGLVIAYDRPAFGLTERPLEWEDDNPYTQESNIELLLGLLEAKNIEQAVLVGNSAGGTLATAFTLMHPERVLALVEVDAAIYQTRPESAFLEWLLNTPQADHIGPLIARRLTGEQGEAFIVSAWHDPGELEDNPEILAGYRKPLKAENWDRALWEHTQASDPPGLSGKLSQIDVPTLVITGDDDQIVPVEDSLRLAEAIPGAELAVLEDCGHLPQEECPQAFLQAVEQFINSVIEEE